MGGDGRRWSGVHCYSLPRSHSRCVTFYYKRHWCTSAKWCDQSASLISFSVFLFHLVSQTSARSKRAKLHLSVVPAKSPPIACTPALSIEQKREVLRDALAAASVADPAGAFRQLLTNVVRLFDDAMTSAALELVAAVRYAVQPSRNRLERLNNNLLNAVCGWLCFEDLCDLSATSRRLLQKTSEGVGWAAYFSTSSTTIRLTDKAVRKFWALKLPVLPAANRVQVVADPRGPALPMVLRYRSLRALELRSVREFHTEGVRPAIDLLKTSPWFRRLLESATLSNLEDLRMCFNQTLLNVLANSALCKTLRHLSADLDHTVNRIDLSSLQRLSTAQLSGLWYGNADVFGPFRNRTAQRIWLPAQLRRLALERSLASCNVLRELPSQVSQLRHLILKCGYFGTLVGDQPSDLAVTISNFANLEVLTLLENAFSFDGSERPNFDSLASLKGLREFNCCVNFMEDVQVKCDRFDCLRRF